MGSSRDAPQFNQAHSIEEVFSIVQIVTDSGLHGAGRAICRKRRQRWLGRDDQALLDDLRAGFDEDLQPRRLRRVSTYASSIETGAKASTLAHPHPFGAQVTMS